MAEPHYTSFLSIDKKGGTSVYRPLQVTSAGCENGGEPRYCGRAAARELAERGRAVAICASVVLGVAADK